MPPSPRLPPELCDHIIDQLCDKPDALKTCSAVSKSWTSRSRKHIFSTIHFYGDADITAWGNAFPDPPNSPAHHTQTLLINHRGKGFPENHLTSFCNVTRLILHVHSTDGLPISLTQLHGFTPSLKSLHMTFPSVPFSDILDLVYSFPLLDNLLLTGLPMASDVKVAPLVRPPFSGSLCLAVFQEMNVMADHLLSLPGGIHFRKLILPWICDQDLPTMVGLISACSRTLESLQILNYAKRTCSRSISMITTAYLLLVEGNTQYLLDLSSALNLKSIMFRCGMASLDVNWITTTVESIKSPHVRKMTLHLPDDPTTDEDNNSQIPEAVYLQWLVLDKALVKYLTARSFKLKVVAPHGTGKVGFEARVEHLLPNLFGKKMLEAAG